MNTPLYEINFPRENGLRLFVKRDDLLPFSLGGNKVRIGWAFYRDMRLQGCDCMVIYGDRRSNLCRVLGNICAQKGIPCYMLCTSVEREQKPSNNSRLMGWLKTEVIPCQKDAVADGVEALLGRLKREGKNPYYIYGNKWGEGREPRRIRRFCARKKSWGSPLTIFLRRQAPAPHKAGCLRAIF